MRFIRTVLTAICIFALGTVALALTPAQRAVLRTISPVASFNFVGASTAALPPWFCGTSTATCGPTATVRSSNATQFDSTGKQTYAPNNLEPYSFQFSSWTTNQSTVSAAGVVLPDGTTGGYKITDNGSASTHTVYTTVSSGLAGQNIIQVVDAKASDLSWIKLLEGIQVTATAWFDLTNGAVGTVSGTGSPTAGIISLGNGWYRCWMRYTLVSTGAYNNQIGPAPSNGSYSYTGTGKGIYVAYSAISTVTYESAPRSQDLVQTNGAAYYGARFDNTTGGTALGLLLEESRTSVVLYARDLTNAAWTKTNITATLNQTGIDGVSNSASSITASAGNGTVLQSITLASSQRSQSAYVKRLVGSGTIFMTTDGGTTWVDVTSQISASYALVSIPAQTVTNPNVGFKITTNADSIAVDWVQNENGAFPTSRMPPITAGTITRAADVVTIGGVAAAVIAGSAGTIILQTVSENGSSPAAVTNLVRGTNSILYRDTTGKVGTTNGTNTLLSGAAPTWNSALRTGLAWSTTGRSLAYTSIASIATDANAASNGGTLYLGSNNGSASESAWYQSMAIYNTRLPDVALKAKLNVGAPYQ